MKTRLKFFKYASILLAGCIYMFFSGCSKNDDSEPNTIPVVTTKAFTNITLTSATGGGEITSDGNAAITASGLVYSNTNATPTTSDSKTEETATGGTFTSELEDLVSGTTYHVRAYATNSVGTGYGEVVTFSTGNAAPIATDVAVTGEVEIDSILTASYMYSDVENDSETGTAFQWYSATDAAGTGEVAIEGATSSTYTILATDEFTYIRVGVTPKAAAGTTDGAEVKSDFVGPVPEAPETVTFMYNGQEVTYGVIVSSESGRKWMDRNLGAKTAAAHYQDHNGYGDLFQRGRLDDGHQLMTWTQDIGVGESAPVNGTTTTLSTTDVPGHSLFVIDVSSTAVLPIWRNPVNPNLWQAPDYINNPCPDGWHIPTNDEWDAENISVAEIISDNPLKLTANGERRTDTGELNNATGIAHPGRYGSYWSSDLFYYEPQDYHYTNFYHFGFVPAEDYDTGEDYLFEWQQGNRSHAAGYSCRCIEDE